MKHIRHYIRQILNEFFQKDHAYEDREHEEETDIIHDIAEFYNVSIEDAIDIFDDKTLLKKFIEERPAEFELPRRIRLQPLARKAKIGRPLKESNDEIIFSKNEKKIKDLINHRDPAFNKQGFDLLRNIWEIDPSMYPNIRKFLQSKADNLKNYLERTHLSPETFQSEQDIYDYHNRIRKGMAPSRIDRGMEDADLDEFYRRKDYIKTQEKEKTIRELINL